MAREAETSRNGSGKADQPQDATEDAETAGGGKTNSGRDAKDDGFARLREPHRALRALLGECAEAVNRR